MRIQIISKSKSRSARIIREETGFRKFSNKLKPDLIINYGLSGKHKERFFSKNPKAKGIPTINLICGYNKYRALTLVKERDILIPESKKKLSPNDKLNDWLLKKYHSYGGKGIKIADQRGSIEKYYYQRYIKNRNYELRVHCFTWINPDEWVVQKRVSDTNEIAWNYSNGGRFITIKNRQGVFKQAVEASTDILNVLRMEFGAIDFIIDKDSNLYFIEINSQPGFNGLSDHIYIDAFNRLKTLDIKEIKKLFNHAQ